MTSIDARAVPDENDYISATGLILPDGEKVFKIYNKMITLYQVYKKETNFFYRFNVMKELLVQSKKFLKDFRVILEAQKRNDSYCGKRHLFIMDTLNFLFNGDNYTRTLDISSWKGALCLNQGSNSVTTEKGGQFQSYVELEDKFLNRYSFSNPATLVILWCCKKNGFEDMIETIILITKDYERNEKQESTVDYSFRFNF